MPRYRAKPVIIEAVQFKADWRHGGVDFPAWLVRAIGAGDVDLDVEPGVAVIKTLAGAVRCMPDDYIIQGATGVYPCKPDTFVLAYERTEEKAWTPPRVMGGL